MDLPAVVTAGAGHSQGMNAATLDPPRTNLASVLADIEQFGAQVVDEQIDGSITTARSLRGVVARLEPGAIGNKFACEAAFNVEDIGESVRITVVERFGDHEWHQPPGTTLDEENGVLPWLRLWASAWIDKASRS